MLDDISASFCVYGRTLNHVAGAVSWVKNLAAATVTDGTDAIVRQVVVLKTMTANENKLDELEMWLGSTRYGP